MCVENHLAAGRGPEERKTHRDELLSYGPRRAADQPGGLTDVEWLAERFPWISIDPGLGLRHGPRESPRPYLPGWALGRGICPKSRINAPGSIRPLQA